jgi:flagellar M-ring protein FliF
MDLSLWTEASPNRKTGLVAGVVFIFAAMLATLLWVFNEPHAVLFSELEMSDAGRVVTELERVKSDYSLADDGTSVLVPQSEVHKTRIKLMSLGMPLAGTVGFEIFDDAGFGMTEFAQRINYQRALEGELTRTIMALDEVKYARVHVVMPEDGLFKDKSGASSASVTLFLKSGLQPGKGQIKGVQNLVAAAIPRMTPGQVTVTDENGLMLSSSVVTARGAEAVSGRLEKKMQIETYFAEKVNEILAQAFGANQAMVSVDVTLDFREITTTTESVVPGGDTAEGGILRKRETRSGGAKRRSEQPSNTTTDVEYQLGRSVSQLIEGPGRITRIGIGVVVPAGMSTAKREAMKELVAVTVGLDETRGDAIAVYSLAGPRVEKSETTAVVQPAPVAPPPMTAATAGTGSMQGNMDSSGNSFPTSLSGFARMVERDPIILILAGIFFVLILILLRALFASGRAKSRDIASSLSSEERERVLGQINQWLDVESTQAKPEASES